MGCVKPRLVLDTSIIVAALRSRTGASNFLLREVADDAVSMLLSPPLFLEYEEVLKRPEQRLAHGLSEEEVNDFLAEVAALSIPVDVYFQWRPLVADPNDEMVLETAINGNASTLITFNVQHFGPARDFGIKVLRPGEFLQRWRRE
jgi:putative PIN family toxin of toxin-antitoxin system